LIVIVPIKLVQVRVVEPKISLSDNPSPKNHRQLPSLEVGPDLAHPQNFAVKKLISGQHFPPKIKIGSLT
jgi:hypothetical protein